MTEVTAAEARDEPSPADVRVAKSAFSGEMPIHWLKRIAQFARPIFDSWRDPGAVMARGPVNPSSRQLVQESEPFTIDLRIESDPDHRRVRLTGQILDARNPEREMQRVDVILLDTEHLIARTSVNAFGEFDLGFHSGEDLHLFINIRGQRAIGIVLPQTLGEE